MFLAVRKLILTALNRPENPFFIDNQGLSAPLVAQKLLGTTGEYAMIILMLMAIMSTGSAEVIAVASIMIYDVYQMYIQPFRPDLPDGHCIMCGRAVAMMVSAPSSTLVSNVISLALDTSGRSDHYCKCANANKCQDCKVTLCM